MSLHNELIALMLDLVEQDHGDEPDIQPSRPLTDEHFRARAASQLPPYVAQLARSSLWSLVSQQSDEAFESVHLARADDCDLSLLTDFYQRVSSYSTGAAGAARCRGRSVSDWLEARHKDDLHLVQALVGQGEVYVLVPAGDQLDCYQPMGERALAHLLWNNFVRFYSACGIGYRDEPRSNEEKMASAMLGYDSAGNLFLGFFECEALLQIHGSTGLFLHGASRQALDQACERLPRHLGIEVAAGR
ncbi:MAG: hypothetical protein ABWY06_01355 [Pseudomonas sp.]|uniref:hypothetical protein n=1 Tax=Pseudomonas sp. TaxID=306 RepID=UPI003395FE3B